MAERLSKNLRDILKALVYVDEAPNNQKRRWYAGITNDPERRLREHNVSPDNPWTWYECDDATQARTVEYALHSMGYSGGGGGGHGGSVFVYTYRITPSTCEDC
jgi:hypothetical protein